MTAFSRTEATITMTEITMKRLIKLTAAACAVAVLAACGSSVKLEDEKIAPIESRDAQRIPPPDPRVSRGAGDVGASNGRQVAQIDVDGAKERDPLADPAGPLAKRSIYFDFDSFVIRDEFRPVVEAHAKFLNTNQNRKVVIQGNTDDRGSREYNLALGQKRSESVRRALGALGVTESQVEAVSFGKEKLRALGSDEAAHAENRRADIVYQ